MYRDLAHSQETDALADVKERGPLLWRLGLPLALLVLEILLASLWLEATTGLRGVIGIVNDWAGALARSITASAAVFLTIVYLRLRSPEAENGISTRMAPISAPLLVVHFLSLGAFLAVSVRVFSDPVAHANSTTVIAWAVLGALVAVSAIRAFVPLTTVIAIVSQAGRSCLYAVVAGILTFPLGEFWKIAKPLAGVTFTLVASTLRPFLPNLMVDPKARVIGTERFSVALDPQCSGLEGIALMLVFGGLWLWIFRDELRIWRSILALPLAIAILWFFNVARICALILIGNAGAGEIAARGFHSQAGWIAFNIVGVALVLGARRMPWLKKHQPSAIASVPVAENSTAVYLLPFVTLLAAGMVSHAASGGFEWLYPLRLFAVAAILLFYRHKYSAIDWGFSSSSLLIGLLVFLIWLLFERFTPGAGGNQLGVSLQQLPAPARVAWIASRTLAAVLTVPIAEELAFRGFLLRRCVSQHFETVKFRQAGLIPVLISSTAFGILHGERWLAGVIAGLLYVFALRRRGRLGDAVAAHAATNALLALWVLAGGNWKYW